MKIKNWENKRFKVNIFPYAIEFFFVKNLNVMLIIWSWIDFFLNQLNPYNLLCKVYYSFCLNTLIKKNYSPQTHTTLYYILF